MEKSCFVAQFINLDDYDPENQQTEIVGCYSSKETAVDHLIDAAEDMYIMLCTNHDAESVKRYDFENRRDCFLENCASQLCSTDVANMRVYNNHIRFEIIPTFFEED